MFLNVSTLIISCIFFSFLQLPSRSLLWRAILQHILLKQKPDLQFKDQQVGRIAAKSANFLDYVQKSFAKLGLALQVNQFEFSRQKLLIFNFGERSELQFILLYAHNVT